MSEELKPCPWCGSIPEVSSYDYKMPSGITLCTQWVVECAHHDCAVAPKADWHYLTREEAIDAWNRRAES